MIVNDRTRTFIYILSFILSLTAVFTMYKSIWKNLLSQPIPQSEQAVIKQDKPIDLQFLLDQNTKNILRDISVESRMGFNRAMADLKRFIGQKNIPGMNEKAPDFKLTGTKNLYDYLPEKNVVLIWYWGDWSSYCSIAIDTYKQILADIEKSNGKIVVITPEKNINLKEMENVEIVVDENNEIAGKFGLVFDVPEEIKDFFAVKDEIKKLPLPAVYIIDNNGIIKYAFIDDDLKHRANPSQILNSLNKINYP